MDPTCLSMAAHFAEFPNALPHYLNITQREVTSTKLDIRTLSDTYRLMMSIVQRTSVAGPHRSISFKPTHPMNVAASYLPRYSTTQTSIKSLDISGEVILCQRI